LEHSIWRNRLSVKMTNMQSQKSLSSTVGDELHILVPLDTFSLVEEASYLDAKLPV
jgi:hypothetical protein